MTAEFSNRKVVGDFNKSSSNEGQKTDRFLDPIPWDGEWEWIEEGVRDEYVKMVNVDNAFQKVWLWRGEEIMEPS